MGSVPIFQKLGLECLKRGRAVAPPPDELRPGGRDLLRQRMNPDLALGPHGADHRLRHHRDAAARGDARDYGVVRTVLHDALRRDAGAPQPGFKPPPVGGARGEGEHGQVRGVFRAADLGEAFRRDQHQLLAEGEQHLQLLRGEGLGDERRFYFSADHP